VFDVELCRPRRISFRYRNGVVCSESGVCYRIVYFIANQVFAAEMVLSATNEVFGAELVLSATNQVFAVELCCPKRIRCSLPKLCCPQRSRCSLLNCVFHGESGVRCRIMLSSGNQVLAAE
jgi:hypothetical protein